MTCTQPYGLRSSRGRLATAARDLAREMHRAARDLAREMHRVARDLARARSAAAGTPGVSVGLTYSTVGSMELHWGFTSDCVEHTSSYYYEG